MKKQRIWNLPDLQRAAADRRAVVGWRNDPLSEHPKPAAWVMSMQASRVLAAFHRGLYIYEPANSKLFGKAKKGTR